MSKLFYVFLAVLIVTAAYFVALSFFPTHSFPAFSRLSPQKSPESAQTSPAAANYSPRSTPTTVVVKSSNMNMDINRLEVR